MVNVLPAMGTADHIEGSVWDRGAKRSPKRWAARRPGGRAPVSRSAIREGPSSSRALGLRIRIAGPRRRRGAARRRGPVPPERMAARLGRRDGQRPRPARLQALPDARRRAARRDGRVPRHRAARGRPRQRRRDPGRAGASCPTSTAASATTAASRSPTTSTRAFQAAGPSGRTWACARRASGPCAAGARGASSCPAATTSACADGFAAIGERATFSRLTGPLMAPVADLVLVRDAPVTEPRATARGGDSGRVAPTARCSRRSRRRRAARRRSWPRPARAQVGDHVRDLVGLDEPLDQRVRAVLAHELAPAPRPTAGRRRRGCATKSSTPSVWVGPAITALTVTPVPAIAFAKPRETPSSAVFVTP